MTDIVQAIDAAEQNYPLAAKTARELMKEARILFQGQLKHQTARHADAFWKRAEKLLGHSVALGGQPTQALIEYTLSYLREQARFVKTGEYSNTDFDTVFRDVYSNPEVMKKFYLDGLMLTHAFWPIHFDMHGFFEAEFLSRVPPQGRGVEYGFGHGLYLLETLTLRPEATADGFDVSEHSVAYAGRLLAHCGVSESRYRLGLADVREPFSSPPASYAWGVFAEIIEHIPDPAFSLRELRRTLADGATLFATTVMHSNAIDHLYQFADLDEVRDMMRNTGFEILAERVLRVRDYDENARDPSVDIALVCRAA